MLARSQHPDGPSRMRKFQVLAGGTVLLAALVAAAEPSVAQSLIQRLFGFGGSRTPEYRLGRMSPFGYGRRFDEQDGWQEDTGTYRTLCVRLCDGFYFPISDNVRRERLYHDNRACMQRCDGEARLYYYSNQGGSVETMVDLAGRNYTALPNAFRYRKKLVSGCTCKPPPWSPEAAVRHQEYAAQQAQSVADGEMEDEPRRPHRAARTAESEVYHQTPPPYTPRPRFSSRWWRTPWARSGGGWR